MSGVGGRDEQKWDVRLQKSSRRRKKWLDRVCQKGAPRPGGWQAAAAKEALCAGAGNFAVTQATSGVVERQWYEGRNV